MKTAIITPNKEDYLKYVEENKSIDFYPVHIKNKDDSQGHIFKCCVILSEWMLIDGFEKVVDSVILRIRK